MRFVFKFITSSLIATSALIGLTGCKTGSDDHVPNGTFEGSTSGPSAHPLKIVLGIPGGDLVGGSWESSGAIAYAHIDGETSFWGDRHYTLSPVEGTCQGKFPLTLKFSSSEITGEVETGAACAAGKISFQLKQTYAPPASL